MHLTKLMKLKFPPHQVPQQMTTDILQLITTMVSSSRWGNLALIFESFITQLHSNTLNAGIFCLFWWNYVLFKQQSSSNETWGSGRFPSTASGDSSVWGGTTSGGSVWGNSNPTTPSTPGILGTFGHLASLYTFIFFYPAFPSFSLCIPFLFSNCTLHSPILSLPSARWKYLACPFY